MLFSIGRGVCLWISWTAFYDGSDFITIRYVVLNLHKHCLHTTSNIYVDHQVEPLPHDTDRSKQDKSEVLLRSMGILYHACAVIFPFIFSNLNTSFMDLGL